MDWWRLEISFYFSIRCNLHKGYHYLFSLILNCFPSSWVMKLQQINSSGFPNMLLCYIFLNRISNALLFLTDGDFSTPKFPNSASFLSISFQHQVFYTAKWFSRLASLSPLQRLQIYLQKLVEMFTNLATEIYLLSLEKIILNVQHYHCV